MKHLAMIPCGSLCLVLVFAFPAGCGTKSLGACDDCTDCPDTDCPDGGCDVDTDDGWQCPDPIAESCPDGEGEALPLIFEASDFGAGTRFVDVAPWSVLAERDADDVRTISVITCHAEEGFAIYPCDASTAVRAELEVSTESGLHAVALTTIVGMPFGDMSLSHFAVLCDDASCALYGASLVSQTPDAVLAPVAGGGLPETGAVRGLWMSPHSYLLCAYGDGVHCFDGTTWTSPVESNPDHPLLGDMETSRFDGVPGAIAAGDLGSVVLSGFPLWAQNWGTSSPDWLAVACYDDGCAIAGEEGAFALRNSDGWYEGCDLGDEDIAALVSLDEGNEEWSSSFGATASGRVFTEGVPVTAMRHPCFTGQVVGANPRAASFLCGIASNVFVMDETALYGTMNCIVD